MGGTGIEVTVDRAQVSLQEQAVLTIRVEGSQSAEPTLPALDDFEVHSRGHSTQMQIINGTVSSAVSYSFTLLPKRVGVFSIGAATVEIAGRIYESAPFTLTVSNAASHPDNDSDIFITADVTNRQPYVGQQVIYTWRFYRRVRVGNAGVTLPDFDGFLIEPLGEQREYQATLHGHAYVVTEIRKALFPQEAGAITLPAASLQCEVVSNERRDDFFNSPFDEFFGRGQRQARTLRTAPIDLHVRALPPGHSELIGTYTVAAQLSRPTLAVGESTTLTITVSGTGHTQHIAEPALPSLVNFKVYDDKPSTQTSIQGGVLTGSKMFRKALVPKQAGVVHISDIALSYFDPSTHTYKTARAAPLTLTVNPGKGTEAGGPPAKAPTFDLPTKVDIRVLGDDILPIYRRGDILSTKRFTRRESAAFAAALLCPPLLFIAALVISRQRTQVSGGRRRKALRRSLYAAKQVDQVLRKGQLQEAAALASRSFREYLGVKLGVEGLAMTAAEARVTLEARGAEHTLAAEVEAWLSRCETAQYGTRAVATNTFASLGPDMKTLLTKLDRTLRI